MHALYLEIVRGAFLNEMQFPGDTQEEKENVGLNFWMVRVMRECDHARIDFNPKHVHDLRVALRRCLSMADGYMAFDSHPAWKKMKKEGKALFRKLGALRDAQVMMQWIQHLAPAEDAASIAMSNHLADLQIRLRKDSAYALQNFSRKKWNSWRKSLSKRASRILPECLAFQHLALECLSEALHLHRQALRNRSQASYHRLRIGLKKFRYTLENFLPGRYEHWGKDLRELQDLLGEMHDLDMLWRTAIEIKAFKNEKIRTDWRLHISQMKGQRLERYREKMLGRSSLLRAWRAELPDCSQLEAAAMARLQTWALFHNPDFPHSELISSLAMQIFDGLDALKLTPVSVVQDARLLLQAAALIHDVGFYKSKKKHHIASYRMICKLDPPLGLNTDALRHIALIVRFHCGALPRVDQKAFSGIPEETIKAIILLSGILRLADSFDFFHDGRIHRLELILSGDTLVMTVPGYSEDDALAEKLAAARHPLETSLRLPVMIR
jgi:CHAD domain-containing protein